MDQLGCNLNFNISAGIASNTNQSSFFIVFVFSSHFHSFAESTRASQDAKQNSGLLVRWLFPVSFSTRSAILLTAPFLWPDLPSKVGTCLSDGLSLVTPVFFSTRLAMLLPAPLWPLKTPTWCDTETDIHAKSWLSWWLQTWSGDREKVFLLQMLRTGFDPSWISL